MEMAEFLTVQSDIYREVERAEFLHPKYQGMDDPVRAVGIIVEEVGEAMEIALDLTSPHRLITGPDRRRADEAFHRALYNETVHTAATAIRLLADMRGRKLIV